MKQWFKYSLIILVIVIAGYFILWISSSYFGWYAYKKWEYRVATTSIEESKKRGVFVKELKFEVDSFSHTTGDFRPYIEKGFRYGHHTSEETVPLIDSKYPYQVSFNFTNSSRMSLFFRKTELIKFDSSNGVWGYLKNPQLTDTVIVDILVPNLPIGKIKVYE